MRVVLSGNHTVAAKNVFMPDFFYFITIVAAGH